MDLLSVLNHLLSEPRFSNQRYESWRMPYAHSSLGIPRIIGLSRWVFCGFSVYEHVCRPRLDAE